MTVSYRCILFRRCWTAILLLLSAGVRPAGAQTFKGLESLFSDPLSYTACFTPSAPVIDGDITDKVWANVPWSASFTDIEGVNKPVPRLNTRVKMLWNDRCLFIAAELEDPHVWATLREHDDIVFHDNDFEVFLDPDNNAHQYFEIEVNALNTVFDLFLAKPYRSNSGALISWDAPGLRTAVKVHGTLNRPSDRDKGWTLEMAIPFRAVTVGNSVRIPSDGDFWRINFSRVEWEIEVRNGKYVKKKDQSGRVLPEHNWVWSPQGVVNMHYPERWGYVCFTMKESGKGPAWQLPYSEKQRRYLWLVYYRQRAFREKHSVYALSLSDLDICESFEIDGRPNRLRMTATGEQFSVFIVDGDAEMFGINDDGLILKRGIKT